MENAKELETELVLQMSDTIKLLCGRVDELGRKVLQLEEWSMRDSGLIDSLRFQLSEHEKNRYKHGAA